VRDRGESEERGQRERWLPHQLVSEDIFGHFKVVSNNIEHRVRGQSQSSHMIRGVDTNGKVPFLHWAECLKHLEITNTQQSIVHTEVITIQPTSLPTFDMCM